MLSLTGFAVKGTTGCDSGGRCDWMQPDRLDTAFFFCEIQASGGRKHGFISVATLITVRRT